MSNSRVEVEYDSGTDIALLSDMLLVPLEKELLVITIRSIVHGVTIQRGVRNLASSLMVSAQSEVTIAAYVEAIEKITEKHLQVSLHIKVCRGGRLPIRIVFPVIREIFIWARATAAMHCTAARRHRGVRQREHASPPECL